MGEVKQISDSYWLSSVTCYASLKFLDPLEDYWIHHARRSSPTSRSLDVLDFFQNFNFIFPGFFAFSINGVMNPAPVPASPPGCRGKMPVNSSLNAKNAFDRIKHLLLGKAGFAVCEMKEMPVPQLCVRATTSFLDVLSTLKIGNVATDELFCEQLTDAEIVTIRECLKYWVKEGEKKGEKKSQKVCNDRVSQIIVP